MTGSVFDHERDAAWLSAFADGELDDQQEAAVKAHLAVCAACREEMVGLSRFDLVMASLRLKEAPPEAWEAIEARLSHRAARRAGWLLLTAGAAATFAWGAWLGVAALLGASGTPWWVKAAILAACVGGLLLLVSALRERLYARRRSRYEDIVR